MRGIWPQNCLRHNSRMLLIGILLVSYLLIENSWLQKFVTILRIFYVYEYFLFRPMKNGRRQIVRGLFCFFSCSVRPFSISRDFDAVGIEYLIELGGCVACLFFLVLV